MKKYTILALISLGLSGCASVDSGGYATSDGSGSYYDKKDLSPGANTLILFVTLGVIGAVIGRDSP